MEKFEKYLYKEVSIIVDLLFEKLNFNNINVELEKSELSDKELEIYMNIYKEYKENLLKLKDKAILKYGYVDDFDYTFATIIQNVVIKKQEGSSK